MAAELALTYATWKRVIDDGRLRVYHFQLTVGPNSYYVVAGANDFLYASTVSAPADVTDFETIYLPFSATTTSAAEALSAASVQAPQRVTGGEIKSDIGRNSTNTPLGIGAIFTGQAENLSSFANITINLFGTPDNATGTLFFEFSPDGVNWDVSRALPVNNLNIFIPFPLRIVLPFFRVRYENGAVAQTAFRLTTVYHHTEGGPLIRLPRDVLGSTEPVPVVRALVEPSLRGSLFTLGADRSLGGENIALPYVAQSVAEFDSPFANNDITVTTSGGASATQTVANGAVLTSANAAGASQARIVSNKRNRYRPGREFRMEFSVGFPAAGLASTDVLIGLSDESGSLNRLEIGYRGAVFGIHIVSGGLVTTIAKASWNGDAADGSALSNFRTNEIPVILDVTKANAWRIRGVWFGVGPIYFDVKSPDDDWITVHTLRYPNTAVVPYIQNPNMFPFMEVVKEGGAPVGTLSAFCFCWTAGTVESDLGLLPHEINSRGLVNISSNSITASATLYTVPTGRQLYIFSLSVVMRNASLVAAGQLDLIDATSGTVGTLLLSLPIAAATNQSSAQMVLPITTITPIRFLLGVRAVVVSGTLTFGISGQGYTKEL